VPHPKQPLWATVTMSCAAAGQRMHICRECALASVQCLPSCSCTTVHCATVQCLPSCSCTITDCSTVQCLPHGSRLPIDEGAALITQLPYLQANINILKTCKPPLIFCSCSPAGQSWSMLVKVGQNWSKLVKHMRKVTVNSPQGSAGSNHSSWS
jgi:hypothetical protein